MKNLKHHACEVPIGKSVTGYTSFFIVATCLSTFKIDYHLKGYSIRLWKNIIVVKRLAKRMKLHDLPIKISKRLNQ